MPIEIRHLRVFSSVARNRSLTRAAAELWLTQPAVSRTLRQLEDEVGVTLVNRTTHQVDLTEEGEVFRARADALLASFDSLIESPVAENRPLRVGHSWAALGALTSGIIREWRAQYPQIPLELLRVDDRYAGLIDGRVDVAVLRGADPAPGITIQFLFDEQRLAALAESDPLASASQLRAEDLRNQVLIQNLVSGATRHEWWPPGTYPESRIGVLNMDDWALKVSTGQGIGIASESLRDTFPATGLRWIPIVDGTPIEVDLAWPKRGAHPATQRFVQLARGLVTAATAAAVPSA